MVIIMFLPNLNLLTTIISAINKNVLMIKLSLACFFVKEYILSIYPPRQKNGKPISKILLIKRNFDELIMIFINGILFPKKEYEHPSNPTKYNPSAKAGICFCKCSLYRSPTNNIEKSNPIRYQK